MFSCTIDDCGLSYTANTVAEISSKLKEYADETYGNHHVQNLKTNTRYAHCGIVSSPGEYMIHTNNEHIYYKICKV